MNNQQTKLVAIAAVVLFHGAVITVMLAQHGCKSDTTRPTSANDPAPAPMAAPAPLPAPVAADSGFSAPTRPDASAPMTPPTPVPMVQMAEPLLTPSPAPVAAAPSPTPVADTSSGPVVNYIVSKGDTLSSVARKNGITQAELVAANAPKVTMNTKLQPGQSLNIPNHKPTTASAATPAVVDGGSTYKAVSGDSLGKIASKNHTTVKALRELNNLTSDNVSVGQVFKLPAASTSSTATASSAAPAAVAAGEGTYTVKNGDSIDKIARSMHISSSELLSINGLTSQTATSIRPGHVLKLPAGAHAAPAAVAPTPADTLPPPVTGHVTLTTSAPPPVTAPVTAFPTTTSNAPPMTPVQ